MPFASKQQRGLLWAKKPKLAKEWTDKYGAGIVGKLIKHNRRKKKL